ncbi:MAG: hypothetical protein P4L50_00200 [Anaerolineaceae bacterium]|nr:hypothetical protein [Anaerolineaceae bacterium]
MPPNGSGRRKLDNFIDTFIDATANLGTPKIFRRWTAISIIAAALEQKVWIISGRRPLHPNLYIFLIAHPGVGKTRTINEGRRLCGDLPEFHLAPVSMTFASLVDALLLAERKLIRQPEGTTAYNSMYICADELGAFVHKYDPEMTNGLSAFYDPTPYQQTRRGTQGHGIDIQIPSPQLNILAGSTPQNLMGFMPDTAWGQGFSSRIIMVFSDERIQVDDFADFGPPRTADLVHDLKIINDLYGEFTITAPYKEAVNDWRAHDEKPIPAHPRLIHYVVRRRVNVYKLSMIASIAANNSLALTEKDFFTGLEWLLQAENFMEDIFKAGAVNADASAMDEIQHFIMVSDLGTGVAERRIVNFARERIPISSILNVIKVMEGAGQIKCVRRDKTTNERFFSSTSATQSGQKVDRSLSSIMKSVIQ